MDIEPRYSLGTGIRSDEELILRLVFPTRPTLIVRLASYDLATSTCKDSNWQTLRSMWYGQPLIDAWFEIRRDGVLCNHGHGLQHGHKITKWYRSKSASFNAKFTLMVPFGCLHLMAACADNHYNLELGWHFEDHEAKQALAWKRCSSIWCKNNAMRWVISIVIPFISIFVDPSSIYIRSKLYFGLKVRPTQ